MVPGEGWHKGIIIQLIMTHMGVLPNGQLLLRKIGCVMVASIHVPIQRNIPYGHTFRRYIYETRWTEHPHFQSTSTKDAPWDPSLHVPVTRSMLSEKYPPMTTPLVKKLNFNVMTEYVNNISIGAAPEVDHINPHTHTYLRHLYTITISLPDKYTPIMLDNNIKEVSVLYKPRLRAHWMSLLLQSTRKCWTLKFLMLDGDILISPGAQGIHQIFISGEYIYICTKTWIVSSLIDCDISLYLK